jgi:Fe-S cluster assembly scaffold protein SufB
MSRGFTEEEAKAVLVRGFMNVDAPLPTSIRKQVDYILDLVAKHAVG